MLEGRPPERRPISVPLDLEDKAMASLSPFQRAAFLLYRSHLQEIDKLTRDLFETVADIRNFTGARIDPTSAAAPLLPSALDPERLAGVARWFASLWLAWLIALYVPDVPDTVGLIVLTNSLSMALCAVPQLPIARCFWPVAFGIALGGAIYVLVMPHLASFAGLAVVLFAAVFLVCYLWHRPTQAVGKVAALALLAMLMGVVNEQTYNFLNVANLAVVIALVFGVLAITTHFPVSFRPEHVFLRLLGRFFRSCAYLVSTLQWDPANPPTGWQRLRRVLHLGDLARVPGQARHLGKYAVRGGPGSIHDAAGAGARRQPASHCLPPARPHRDPRDTAIAGAGAPIAFRGARMASWLAGYLWQSLAASRGGGFYRFPLAARCDARAT